MLVVEGQLAHLATFAKPAVAQVRPAADFVMAYPTQLGHIAAQQVAQQHQFCARIAEQWQAVVVGTCSTSSGAAKPCSRSLAYNRTELGPINARLLKPSPFKSPSVESVEKLWWEFARKGRSRQTRVVL
ncbi:hypothetical protein AB6846_01795 [Serratia proteamaculans]